MRERCGEPIPSEITNRNSYTGDWLARSYVGTLAWLRLVGAVAEYCDVVIVYGEGRFD